MDVLAGLDEFYFLKQLRYGAGLGCWENKTAGDCCTILVAWCMEPCQCQGRLLRKGSLWHLCAPGQGHAG